MYARDGFGGHCEEGASPTWQSVTPIESYFLTGEKVCKEPPGNVS